jgi:hypothetical protein
VCVFANGDGQVPVTCVCTFVRRDSIG